MAVKLLRNIGLYLGHLLTAVVGTAILTSVFGMLFHPRSISEFVGKEWALSVVFASLLGFLAYHISKARVGTWVWVPAVAWFAFGFILLMPTTYGQSALSPNHGLWDSISGFACSEGVRAAGCRTFFLFTIPLVRCVSYSIGMFAAMTMRGSSRRVKPSSDPGGSSG